MYNRFQLAKRFLNYYIRASNGKGHGIHSPFVFEFVRNVLNDRKHYECYHEIEAVRAGLLASDAIIEVEDFGAGSAVLHTNKRRVKDIARSSLKPPRFAQLLFRIAQYYQPANLVEIGTSLGITSAYLGRGAVNGLLYTCEGSRAIADIARRNFKTLKLRNVELLEGEFSTTLPQVIARIDKVDFAFIDGNHKEEPTMQYYRELLKHSTDTSIFVFDDIHWSACMEAAWTAIRQDPAVTLTIDLFYVGLVFFSPGFKVKQHFSIRF
jgi:predicted O-methyltransferase YrrM